MTRTIDMTPTWPQAAQIIAAALENGTDKGREAARGELFRMANLLDQLQREATATHQPAIRPLDSDADPHERLSLGLTIAGEACDLGAIRQADQGEAHRHLEALWGMWRTTGEADA
jgi:hypothetical protein